MDSLVRLVVAFASGVSLFRSLETWDESRLTIRHSYNAVIYTTSAATDYQVAVVTEDFVQGGSWNESRAFGSLISLNVSDQVSHLQPDVDLFQSLQQNIKSLTKMDLDACHKAYAHIKYELAWRNGLVVVSDKLNDSLVKIYGHYPDNFDDDASWPDNWSKAQQCQCNGMVNDAQSRGDLSMFLSSTQAQAYNTTLDKYWCQQDTGKCTPGPPVVDKYCYMKGGSEACIDAPTGQLSNTLSLTPTSCYLEPDDNAKCTVEINRWLLLVVIICNTVKIISMVIMAVAHTWTRIFEPVATIGDCIATFVDSPEPATAHMGPISLSNIKGYQKALKKVPLSEWQAKPLKKVTRTWSCAWGLPGIENRNWDCAVM